MNSPPGTDCPFYLGRDASNPEVYGHAAVEKKRIAVGSPCWSAGVLNIPVEHELLEVVTFLMRAMLCNITLIDCTANTFIIPIDGKKICQLQTCFLIF